MDRFSSDDARRIFAEAAQTPSEADAPGPHLTLAELQDIGRSAGLDPAAVAAAAARLRDAPPDVPTWHGVPQVTRCTRTVAGTLTDDAWAAAVADCRATFGVQGHVETIGTRRTWAYVVGEASQTTIATLSAETRDGTTRLTATSANRGEAAAARVFTALFVLGALMAAADSWQGAAGRLWLAVLLAVGAVATYGYLRWSAPRNARRDQTRYRALLDRVADRIDPPARVPQSGPETAVRLDAASAGDETRLDRLDLDGLDAEPLSDRPSPSPLRSRA